MTEQNHAWWHRLHLRRSCSQRAVFWGRAKRRAAGRGSRWVQFARASRPPRTSAATYLSRPAVRASLSPAEGDLARAGARVALHRVHCRPSVRLSRTPSAPTLHRALSVSLSVARSRESLSLCLSTTRKEVFSPSVFWRETAPSPLTVGEFSTTGGFSSVSPLFHTPNANLQWGPSRSLDRRHPKWKKSSKPLCAPHLCHRDMVLTLYPPSIGNSLSISVFTSLPVYDFINFEKSLLSCGCLINRTDRGKLPR